MSKKKPKKDKKCEEVIEALRKEGHGIISAQELIDAGIPRKKKRKKKRIESEKQ
ncbi:MAG: hypothetical protein KKH52_03940 [Nanoarchaeota archaeon]|nr:hypothetical protein [Nanoarchaeota archaeon]MBU1622953.1 hypothetical protein [Nanoarchaeota archaeon]MBU1974520.1 hypothetical protein [Nanoarchaeota archaeon]